MNYNEYRALVQVNYRNNETEILNICLDKLDVQSLKFGEKNKNIFTKEVEKVTIISVILRFEAKYDRLQFLVVDSASKIHRVGLDIKVPMTEFDAYKYIKEIMGIDAVAIKPTVLEKDGVNYMDVTVEEV